MVLNKLKQIRDELKTSAVAYDRAFKNTALIAAEELSDHEIETDGDLELTQTPAMLLENSTSEDNSDLTKEYFLEKYGSLKNTKIAYQKIYGKQKYGRSWSDFITIAKQLNTAKTEKLSLEARITKIEDFLKQFGYQSR